MNRRRRQTCSIRNSCSVGSTCSIGSHRINHPFLYQSSVLLLHWHGADPFFKRSSCGLLWHRFFFLCFLYYRSSWVFFVLRTDASFIGGVASCRSVSSCQSWRSVLPCHFGPKSSSVWPMVRRHGGDPFFGRSSYHSLLFFIGFHRIKADSFVKPFDMLVACSRRFVLPVL